MNVIFRANTVLARSIGYLYFSYLSRILLSVLFSLGCWHYTQI